MADKKLNEVTKVTDMAYVPVIMSDGSIGQIAKADLASVVAEHIGVKVIKFTSWGSGGNVYKITLDYTDITKITIAATFMTGDRTGSIVDIVLSRGQYGLKAGLSNSVDGSNNYIRVLSHESALYIKAEDYVYGCISMDCVVNCEKVAVSDIPNDALVLL